MEHKFDPQLLDKKIVELKDSLNSGKLSRRKFLKVSTATLATVAFGGLDVACTPEEGG